MAAIVGFDRVHPITCEDWVKSVAPKNCATLDLHDHFAKLEENVCRFPHPTVLT